MHKKASGGQINDFSGLNAPYQPPGNPELRLDSSTMGIDSEVDAVMNLLHGKNIRPGQLIGEGHRQLEYSADRLIMGNYGAGSLNGTIKEPVPIVQAENGKSPESFLSDLYLLGFLCLLEILTFAPFVRKVGFYLDDWLMLQTPAFSDLKISFGAFSNYFFNDPKVIIRPVEVLHFALCILLSDRDLWVTTWSMASWKFSVFACFMQS